MIKAAARAPTIPQRPKTIQTFSNATDGKASRSTTPLLSSQSSKSRDGSPTRFDMPVGGSDQAIATLIRRVLCSQVSTNSSKDRPIDELLPPLTSSNDVDLQLYAIIAVVFKDLVHTWYGKITPDETFTEEVIKIVAHCTRALEGRLRRTDLELLFLDEIPALIEDHINGRCQFLRRCRLLWTDHPSIPLRTRCCPIAGSVNKPPNPLSQLYSAPSA